MPILGVHKSFKRNKNSWLSLRDFNQAFYPLNEALNTKKGGIVVKIEDLELALEFNSSGNYDNEVYLDNESGKIIYVSDLVDEEPPIDLFENEKYALLPTKQDLDLGKSLALKFAHEKIPEHYNEVYSIFSSKGAYSRFKSLLERRGLLELWYKYEQEKSIEAIKEWCNENEIQCI